MFDRLTRFLTLISGRGDLVIGILVLVSVLIMILPLPTPLVDVLITANIAASVLILLTAIYVVRPIEFSSLPSIILIATLFRLAITITTSRLVLLQADAGDIINAFGSFVIGGNLAVGLVIFLIITIAQFVVITKGSERVAEVAARFNHLMNDSDVSSKLERAPVGRVHGRQVGKGPFLRVAVRLVVEFPGVLRQAFFAFPKASLEVCPYRRWIDIQPGVPCRRSALSWHIYGEHGLNSEGSAGIDHF